MTHVKAPLPIADSTHALHVRLRAPPPSLRLGVPLGFSTPHISQQKISGANWIPADMKDVPLSFIAIHMWQRFPCVFFSMLPLALFPRNGATTPTRCSETIALVNHA